MSHSTHFKVGKNLFQMLDITIPTSITVSTIPQEVVILVDDGDLPMADRIKKPGTMTSSWSVLPFVLALGLVLGLVLGLALLRLFAFGGLASFAPFCLTTTNLFGFWRTLRTR